MAWGLTGAGRLNQVERDKTKKTIFGMLQAGHAGIGQVLGAPFVQKIARMIPILQTPARYIRNVEPL